MTISTTAVIAEILAILSQYGQSKTEEIKKVIPRKTGRTANSVRYEVRDDGDKASLRLIGGRPYFLTVQTGRKPTPEKKPSKQFVDNIREWLQAQGKDQGPAYAIARSINLKGTKLWQAGGNNIISNIVNDSLTEKISQDVLKEFARYYLVATVNIFNGNSNQSANRA